MIASEIKPMRSSLLPRRKCGFMFVVWCLILWSLTYLAFRLQTNRERPPDSLSDGLSGTSMAGTGPLLSTKHRKTLSEQTKSHYMNSTVIQTEMYSRRARIKQHCEELHLHERIHRGPFSKEYLRLIMVNRKEQIMFCFIPKIANTNFRRLFLHIQGVVDQDEVPAITGYEIYTKYAGKFLSLNKLGKKESQSLLKHYKKILFVREPLERLLSAYRNKYHHPNEGIRMEYIEKLQEFYNNHPRVLANRGNLRTNFTQQPLSFREFLVYWTDSFDQKCYINEHFVPTFELSNPCEVNYDYIGRYETLHKDVRFIFQNLGFDIEFPQRNDNYSVSQTVDLVEHYYKDIPNRLFKKTWNYLRIDSILFGYSLPEWARKKLK